MGFWANLFKRKPRIEISEGKASAGSGASSGQVVFPSDGNIRKQIEEAWKNVWASRCIDFIAKSCSSVEWRFEENTGKEVRILDNPELIRLLKRPNGDESFTRFVYKAIAYLKTNGNSYVRRIKPLTRVAAFPSELRSMMPDKMEPFVSEGKLTKYVYKDNLTDPVYPVNPVTGDCDILHMKEFNPLDEIFGKSRIQIASYEIDSSNQATKWNFKLLCNEARLGLLLLFKQFLNGEQLDLVEKKVAEKFAGADKAGKTLILGGDGGVDARPYSMTPKDMDFIEGSRETARKIAVALGVPPLLLNIPGDNTYSNYQAARLAFWEETVLYDLNYFKDEMSSWLFPDSRVYLNYDLSKVPAFMEKRMLEWQTIDKLTSLTLNEKRKLMGYEPVDGGDSVFVPAQMIPLGMDITPPDQGAVKEKLINKGFAEEIVNELVEAVEW